MNNILKFEDFKQKINEAENVPLFSFQFGVSFLDDLKNITIKFFETQNFNALISDINKLKDVWSVPQMKPFKNQKDALQYLDSEALSFSDENYEEALKGNYQPYIDVWNSVVGN